MYRVLSLTFILCLCDPQLIILVKFHHLVLHEVLDTVILTFRHFFLLNEYPLIQSVIMAKPVLTYERKKFKYPNKRFNF